MFRLKGSTYTHWDGEWRGKLDHPEASGATAVCAEAGIPYYSNEKPWKSLLLCALTPFQPFSRALLVSVSAPLPTQRASLVRCGYQKRQKPSSSVSLLFTLPLFLLVSHSLSIPPSPGHTVRASF